MAGSNIYKKNVNDSQRAGRQKGLGQLPTNYTIHPCKLASTPGQSVSRGPDTDKQAGHTTQHGLLEEASRHRVQVSQPRTS